MTRDLKGQMILEKERAILDELSVVENELIYLNEKRDILNNNLRSLEEKKAPAKKKINAAGKVGKYKKMKKP
jgi:hypothetical protein